ncbi:anti-phage dCTP deaminase [Haliangium sp.]|uniref:anti-phage dCTP deaminase n=1 Tax=Haliangium sp. TaxID=2663208 RepID=UPI003D0BC979
MREQAAKELFFAVVGHVGSGTTTVARSLKSALERRDRPDGPYDVHLLKARDEIEAWAREQGKQITRPESPTIAHAQRLQNLGDAMRKEGGDHYRDQDHAAVARRLVRKVRSVRAMAQGRGEPGEHDIVEPDGAHRAYIFDAVRHPAEVHLLRSVYQNAFTLIGVVCDDEEERIKRLSDKYRDAGRDNAREFMARDAKAEEKYGQRVADAFHLADVFIDNSEERTAAPSASEHAQPRVADQLNRIIKLITHEEIIRPSAAETAMYHAYGAMMRSACLSRQVGCALLDRHGNVFATGANEVPRARGGVYGASIDSGVEEGEARCAYREHAYCSNTREQEEIVASLIEDLAKKGLCTVGAPENREALTKLLRDSRIGSLLEFSRAVHAEMDALLTAARGGSSPVGARAFVTTHPCHYCARHLVAAGIDEVQYIEPYPKSLARKLHEDAITNKVKEWVPPSRGGSRVLFRPFTGVAPRMYRRAFLKERELKDKKTGDMKFGDVTWADVWHLGRASYIELEAKLSYLDGE